MFGEGGESWWKGDGSLPGSAEATAGFRNEKADVVFGGIVRKSKRSMDPSIPSANIWQHVSYVESDQPNWVDFRDEKAEKSCTVGRSKYDRTENLAGV